MGEHQRFTCGICTESSLTSDLNLTNCATAQCSHPFCNKCMIKYISSRLEDNVGDIDCPDLNCTNKLDPPECAAVAGRPLFVRWCDVLFKAAIVGLDKSFCPYRGCNVLIVNECGGKVGKSSCPKCKRLFCFDCSEVWHEGYGCAQFRVRIRDENNNDTAFNSLVKKKNWKRCPLCRHFVERAGGCYIMKCRCGNRFCYKCGGNIVEGVCRCRYLRPQDPQEQTPPTTSEICYSYFVFVCFIGSVISAVGVVIALLCSL